MPRITDQELIDARIERNQRVRDRFEVLFSVKGLRIEVLLPMMVKEFALSQGTIMQIVKYQGKYKD